MVAAPAPRREMRVTAAAVVLSLLGHGGVLAAMLWLVEPEPMRQAAPTAITVEVIAMSPDPGGKPDGGAGGEARAGAAMAQAKEAGHQAKPGLDAEAEAHAASTTDGPVAPAASDDKPAESAPVETAPVATPKAEIAPVATPPAEAAPAEAVPADQGLDAMASAEPSPAAELSAVATDAGGRELQPAPPTAKPAAATRPSPSRQAQARSMPSPQRQRVHTTDSHEPEPQSATAAVRPNVSTDAGTDTGTDAGTDTGTDKGGGLAAGAGGTQLAHAGLGTGTAGFARGPRFRLGGPGNPLPPYPETARRRGQEGQVVLAVVVAADGTALQVSVADSSGYRLLDQSAARTVQRWRFTPETGRGQAIVHVPIAFRLTD